MYSNKFMEEGAIYPDYRIHDFVSQGIVSSDVKIDAGEKGGQIQPSSLDLRCGFGKKIWHMPYSFNPSGKDLTDFLNSVSTHSFQLDEERFLHKKVVYIIELEERVNFPEGISAKSNPKSTTGRCDIHVRMLTENGSNFDQVKDGYKGKLYLEVISNSFDLFLPPGFSFSQMRFMRENDQLEQRTLRHLARGEPLLFDESGNPLSREDYIHDNAVYLTLNANPDDLGYKAREDAPSLDLSAAKESIPLSRYFERINSNEEGIVIIPDSFYLLKSKERSSIPEFHCAEMVDVSTSLGEFRSHYAGFFDPGFNSICVLEVRNTGTAPFLLKEGQPISSLVFFEMTGKPRILYGEGKASNYQGQNVVKPAKFFYNDLRQAA